jgi:hypothetical protein
MTSRSRDLTDLTDLTDLRNQIAIRNSYACQVKPSL